LRSPKLTPSRSPDWYAYYAGYSADFVDDVLDALELDPSSRVLDPWNGSGTTTARALAKSYRAVGFDINPALVVVARGRVLSSDIEDSLQALAADIIDHARQPSMQDVDDDPLRTWFDDATARRLRRVEVAIQHVLVDHDTYAPLLTPGRLDRVSSLAAFFYVALFEVVRHAIRPYVSTNPTWVKLSNGSERICLSEAQIRSAFQSSTLTLEPLRHEGPPSAGSEAPTINQASSVALPLKDDSIDAVVSSPPYCTRIDYVVATRPELALLGYHPGAALKPLRDQMLGTPTIARQQHVSSTEWGATTTAFLDAVKTHSSRASGTYYYKHFLQYFDGLYESVRELRRVVTPGGRVALVVQDSYYKDVHANLAEIIGEMAASLGWSTLDRKDYEIQSTKAAINPRVRKYRSTFGAMESALILG
jgi:DNA modification methylase